MYPLAPENPRDRSAVYRFFDGKSSVAKEGLDASRLRVPLLKSFLLEHVAPGRDRKPRTPREIFEELGTEVRMLDDDFMQVSVFPKGTEDAPARPLPTGFVERFDERFFAYYTCEDSVEARKRVQRWLRSPELDACWFSGPLMQKMWDRDVSLRGDDRFCRMSFHHHSLFDRDSNEVRDAGARTAEPKTRLRDPEDDDSDDLRETDRRRARVVLTDRIGKIRGILKSLQGTYAPFHAIQSLRIPSLSVRGGHDLHQRGQITNRTGEFVDHRNTVLSLYRRYKGVLEATETSAWGGRPGDARNRMPGGAPLIVRFAEELDVQTFDRFVAEAFRERGPFKLWGNPIPMGTGKVHVYGADRHLWQPITLEFTTEGVVALLPRGTCGNTFHRLVANIQQYLAPDIEAWIGAKRFEDIAGDWPSGDHDAA